jgi:hypothetical protein
VLLSIYIAKSMYKQKVKATYNLERREYKAGPKGLWSKNLQRSHKLSGVFSINKLVKSWDY